MTQGGNIYRDAERRLLDAIRAGEVCDFPDGAKITAEEMASWGPERTIRGALLRRLLTAKDAQYAADGIRLRGAAIEGNLDLRNMNVVPFDLDQCRIATAQANEATFTGDASFRGTTFTGTAGFHGATFTGGAGFESVTFDHVRFDGTVFNGDAWFDEATTFHGPALFSNAIFNGNAEFGDAIFTGGAWFDGATFTGDAEFDGATFIGGTEFNGATFAREAEFVGAIFTT